MAAHRERGRAARAGRESREKARENRGGDGVAAAKAEPKDQCVQAAKGPILEPQAAGGKAAKAAVQEGGAEVIAKVGKPAPDFEASAFVSGGFKNVKLSDYKGKWVVLCFYPGDFTYV